MSSTVLLCLLIGVFVVSAKVKEEPKTYQIDLADDYYTRWRKVIEDKGEALREAVPFFLTHYHVNSTILYQFLGELGEKLNAQKEFVAEMKAIADLAGVSLRDILIVNYMYELNAFCTSIVARDSQGRIFHGRNLDYYYQQQLANLTVRAEFLRNGTHVFHGEVLVGFVGVVTGFRPSAFGLSLNQRVKGTFMEKLWAVALGKGIQVTYMLREVLSNATTYDEALEMIRGWTTAAPVYFILSGLSGNEGRIIARDTESVDYEIELTDSNWFIVQTNVDQGQYDVRQVKTEQNLAALGSDSLSLESLQKIMSTGYTRTFLTIYSTSYSAALNESLYSSWF